MASASSSAAVDDEDALLAVAAPPESREEARKRKEAGRGQLDALRAKQVKVQRRRVAFLLGQSELFAHFLKVGSGGPVMGRAPGCLNRKKAQQCWTSSAQESCLSGRRAGRILMKLEQAE